MEIIYVLCPSYVRSNNDFHYISSKQLIDLYKIQGKLCTSYEHSKGLKECADVVLVYLHPLADGNYKEWLEKELSKIEKKRKIT